MFSQALIRFMIRQCHGHQVIGQRWLRIKHNLIDLA